MEDLSERDDLPPPAVEPTLSAGAGPPDRPMDGWKEVRVDWLADAEDVLDALATLGREDVELAALPGGGFVVRWR